jgi:hypothetical protein
MANTCDAGQAHNPKAAATDLTYGRESFNRIVAPVLAGFSLPAIVTLATSDIPSQPWRDITLSFMATATGLFLAGYQLTTGSLYTHFRESWGKARAAISFSGMAFLVAALIVIIAAAVHRWWVVFPLLVLFLGGIIPLGVRGWLAIQR